MIIPIKCFTCGMVIADKYRYYLEQVRKHKKTNTDQDNDEVTYLTKDYYEKSAEGKVMDDLGITRMCCRRHFLSHVDIE